MFEKVKFGSENDIHHLSAKRGNVDSAPSLNYMTNVTI